MVSWASTRPRRWDFQYDTVHVTTRAVTLLAFLQAWQGPLVLTYWPPLPIINHSTNWIKRLTVEVYHQDRSGRAEYTHVYRPQHSRGRAWSSTSRSKADQQNPATSQARSRSESSSNRDWRQSDRATEQAELQLDQVRWHPRYLPHICSKGHTFSAFQSAGRNGGHPTRWNTPERTDTDPSYTTGHPSRRHRQIPDNAEPGFEPRTEQLASLILRPQLNNDDRCTIPTTHQQKAQSVAHSPASPQPANNPKKAFNHMVPVSKQPPAGSRPSHRSQCILLNQSWLALWLPLPTYSHS